VREGIAARWQSITGNKSTTSDEGDWNIPLAIPAISAKVAIFELERMLRDTRSSDSVPSGVSLSMKDRQGSLKSSKIAQSRLFFGRDAPAFALSERLL